MGVTNSWRHGIKIATVMFFASSAYAAGGRTRTSSTSLPTGTPTPFDYKTWPVPDGPVQTPSPEYIKLLGDSLLFYEAQRSGPLPTNNRISWRHDSGLKDGADNNVDLVGGYYDAGDYMKFTFPLAFSLNMVNWGALEYWQGYVMANQTSYLREMLKWGTDWIIKAHPQPQVLYVQVGLNEVDNNYWGPDTGIPTPRPSFQVNATNPGTDVVAETAASMASSSLVFQLIYGVTQDPADAEYARVLLTHAVSLMEFAVSAKPYQLYQKAVPAAAKMYGSLDYNDELLWASAWMYRATGNSSWLDLARQTYNSTETLHSSTLPVDWDNKIGASYVLLAELTSGNAGLPATSDAALWKQEAEAYLDSIANLTGDGQLTPGGLLWFRGTSDSNGLIPAQTASLLLLIYASSVLRPVSKNSVTTTEAIRAAQYEHFAMGQMDYLFGNNPMNEMYIIGETANSPKNPAHPGAHGGTQLGHLDQPAETMHVLLGAIVGGPNATDHFDDNRADWAQSEVALNYNAVFQSIVARQVMYSTAHPFYYNHTLPPSRVGNTTNHNETSTSSASTQNTAIIAGSVVAGVVVLCAVVLLLWKRKAIKSWASGKPKPSQSNLLSVEELAPPMVVVDRVSEDTVVGSHAFGKGKEGDSSIRSSAHSTLEATAEEDTPLQNPEQEQKLDSIWSGIKDLQKAESASVKSDSSKA